MLDVKNKLMASTESFVQFVQIVIHYFFGIPIECIPSLFH